MKLLRVITYIFFTSIFVFFYTSEEFSSTSTFLTQDIIINAKISDTQEYEQVLKKYADDTDVVLVNQRLVENEANWYCIGQKCNLENNEYFSTKNDKNAKAVLPIRTLRNNKVYSFELLKNISTSNNIFKVAGNKSSIENFIDSDIEGISISQTESHMRSSNKSQYFMLLIIFITMYSLTIIINMKQYALNKYNGKYFKEEFQLILFRNLKLVLGTTPLYIGAMYIFLNNTGLWMISIRYILLVTIINYIILVAIESIICSLSRLFYSPAKSANVVSNFASYTLLLVYFPIAMLSCIYTANACIDIERLYKQNSEHVNIPSDYYTYGVTYPGMNIDLKYMSKVFDPKHAEFYKETEDKYNGIVMCFSNCPTDFPIVNENYLKFINHDVALDDKLVNFLVSEDNGGSEPGVNTVYVSNDKYPYLDQSTGLVNYYRGPVYVMDSNLVNKIEASAISQALQYNNYYLQLDSAGLKEVEKLKLHLGLEQNISALHTATSISNNFKYTLQKQLRRTLMGLALLISTNTIIILLYESYRFELKKRKFLLNYLYGYDFNKQVGLEILKVGLPIIIASIILFNKYSLIYLIFMLTLVTILILKKHHQLITNSIEITKE